VVVEHLLLDGRQGAGLAGPWMRMTVDPPDTIR